jgi:hypothetical protein
MAQNKRKLQNQNINHKIILSNNTNAHNQNHITQITTTHLHKTKPAHTSKSKTPNKTNHTKIHKLINITHPKHNNTTTNYPHPSNNIYQNIHHPPPRIIYALITTLSPPLYNMHQKKSQKKPKKITKSLNNTTYNTIKTPFHIPTKLTYKIKQKNPKTKTNKPIKPRSKTSNLTTTYPLRTTREYKKPKPYKTHEIKQITLMTNQVPKHYTNLYTLLKQHKNIIPILHHSTSTTKLTPLKNLNLNKTKPKTINIYRHSPTIASTSRIELIKIPNYTIDYPKYNPITQYIMHPNFTNHPKIKRPSHNTNTSHEKNFILNSKHTQSIVYTLNTKLNQNPKQAL